MLDCWFKGQDEIKRDNAGISIGLMNSVLKRFVERGWIMLTNVNLRKLSYVQFFFFQRIMKTSKYEDVEVVEQAGVGLCLQGFISEKKIDCKSKILYF